MHAEVREIGPSRREIEIRVEAEEVGRFIDSLVVSFRRRYTFSGFRPGKAPDSVVRSRFQDEIESAVHSDFVPRLIEQALTEHRLHPAAPGDVSGLRYLPGQPLSFVFRVDVWPEIELKPYEGTQFDLIVEDVTEAKIDQFLESLRDQAAEETVVDRPAQPGDIVAARIENIDESGGRVRGTKREKIRLLVDSPGLLPEFREVVRGVSARDAREITVRYPDDYAGELRGQARRYRLEIAEVRERRIPPLDDDFAQRVAPGADLATLRSRVRLRLESEARMVARDRLESAIVTRLIADNPFDLPAGAIEGPLERARQRFKEEGRAVTEEELQQFYRPQLERLRRRDHILVKVAEREGITLSAQDMDAEIESMARREGRTPEEVRKDLGDLERFRDFLFERKVFDALVSKLSIREQRASASSSDEVLVDAEFPGGGDRQGGVNS